MNDFEISRALIDRCLVCAIRDAVGDPPWTCSNAEGMDLVRIEALGEIQGALRLAEELRAHLEKEADDDGT